MQRENLQGALEGNWKWPKNYSGPSSNISEILKREYHMNRARNGTRRKTTRNINWSKLQTQ